MKNAEGMLSRSLDDCPHLGRGSLVEAIIKVVSRARAYGEKHTNAAECCQSYVVGSGMVNVFAEGKENVLRIYLKIRHTPVNGVESL